MKSAPLMTFDWRIRPLQALETAFLEYETGLLLPARPPPLCCPETCIPSSATRPSSSTCSLPAPLFLGHLSAEPKTLLSYASAGSIVSILPGKSESCNMQSWRKNRRRPQLLFFSSRLFDMPDRPAHPWCRSPHPPRQCNPLPRPSFCPSRSINYGFFILRLLPRLRRFFPLQDPRAGQFPCVGCA